MWLFCIIKPKHGAGAWWQATWNDWLPVQDAACWPWISAGLSNRPGFMGLRHKSAPDNRRQVFGQRQLTWWQTRDFSRRYCSTRAPSITPSLLKKISKYFPKRLELSFRIVFAFPNAAWERTVTFELFFFISADSCCTSVHHWSTSSSCVDVVPSSIGLDCRICSSICWWESSPLTAAKYCRISFVLSVFPAPDSPLRKSEKKMNQEVKIRNTNSIPDCLSATVSGRVIVLTWWCSTGSWDYESCYRRRIQRWHRCGAGAPRAVDRGTSEPEGQQDAHMKSQCNLQENYVLLVDSTSPTWSTEYRG